MKVLVTDGCERAALAVVRSLGRAGHRVGVVSTDKRCLAGASRHARFDRRVPDPLRDPDGFTCAVQKIVIDESIETLVPVSEASLHAVLRRRNEFGKVTIPFPEHEVFEAVCDKARVHEVAQELGIAVPRQIPVNSPAEGGAVGERLGFPVVVKPSRSVVGTGGSAAKTHVRCVSDGYQLASALEEVPAEGFPVLVQERIEGPGTGVFLLLWEDELLAAFCHRRIREKPPSGGVSVLRESVPLDGSLLRVSRELLERFGWRGVAMVEYKRDEDTAIPYLMEINGRFWGSLQLAVDAGVDFPRLLVEAVSGQMPEPVLEYEKGVRTRWLLGDVDHLLARLRRSRDELHLRSDAAGRVGALGSFLATFGPGSRNEVFRWSDPGPGLRETVGWMRDVIADRAGKGLPQRSASLRTE